MLRIVDLDEGDWDAYEKGARFFSYLAYPGEEETAERERFWTALCRWAIRESIRIDKDAAWNVPVRAAHFVRDGKSDEKIWDKGMTQIHYRLVTAECVALPHLKAAWTGVLVKLGGFEPTIGNMLDLARWSLADYGWKEDSDNSAAKTKLWKPTRPVVHAAAAYTVFCSEHLCPIFDVVDDLKLPIFITMRSTLFIRSITALSEIFRLRVPGIQQLRIKEDELVQFKWGDEPAVRDPQRLVSKAELARCKESMTKLFKGVFPRIDGH